MVWVERLLAAVGRDSLELELDWQPTERELGLEIPADYKELCRAFGVGEFSDFLNLLSPDATDTYDLLGFWRASIDISRRLGMAKGQHVTFEPFDPYEVGSGGVLTWGTSWTKTLYSWLAPAPGSSDWPILVHYEERGHWQRIDMLTSEFVFRLLSEPDFSPGRVLPIGARPTFLTAAELSIPGFD